MCGTYSKLTSEKINIYLEEISISHKCLFYLDTFDSNPNITKYILAKTFFAPLYNTPLYNTPNHVIKASMMELSSLKLAARSH